MIDILDYHRSVLEQYQNYIKSFLGISDERIGREVENFLEEKKGLWKDPLIQFKY